MQAEEKAVHKLEMGQRIAARLRRAAIELENQRALKEALLIDRCSRCENEWVGKEFETVTGNPESSDGADVELWDAHGRFWDCSNRLCPDCSEKLRRRARRVVVSALKLHRPRLGYANRFITLTQPTLTASLLESLRIIRRAWTLLYKRDFWRRHVDGGALGIEFTLNERGYHTHLHILASSKFMPVEQLIDEWEHCVTIAHGETEFAAVDHCKICGHCREGHDDRDHQFRLNASVSIRLVRPKAGSSHAIAMKDAIKEVIKYVTKPQSWLEMGDRELVECASIVRWPRMFELFGSLKTSARQGSSTILDTERITHGETPGETGEPPSQADKPVRPRLPGLRRILDKLTLEELDREITRRLKAAIAFRLKQLRELYPFVRFFRLVDYVALPRLAILRPVVAAS